MTRKHMIAALLGLGAAMMTASPACAQLTVYDPSNYAQNLLTAARALEQINNQIQSLQNEAQSLINQAKNLSKIDFPQMTALQQRLQQIDRLMGQAQAIEFRVDRLDEQFSKAFPSSSSQLTRDQRVATAKERLESEMTAFRQSMGLQSEIAENVRDDATSLKAIVDKSQGAEGSLQAQQATNQLLALAIKQQLQIQQMLAAHFRSTSLEQAESGQTAREAQESTKRFLGDGKAYTPR